MKLALFHVLVCAACVRSMVRLWGSSGMVEEAQSVQALTRVLCLIVAPSHAIQEWCVLQDAY